MAAVQLKVFQNYPLFPDSAALGLSSEGMLQIHAVQLPGSLSFNNVALAVSAAGNTDRSASFYFGLYSRTGSTISLANSASISWTVGANARSWLSLATSATQNLTPGDWYFAVMSSSSSATVGLYCFPVAGSLLDAAHGGPFFRGLYSVTQTAMPASIATSDLSFEGTVTRGFRHPYIVISA